MDFGVSSATRLVPHSEASTVSTCPNLLQEEQGSTKTEQVTAELLFTAKEFTSFINSARTE